MDTLKTLKEERISYETAKLAADKGFDIFVRGYYDDNENYVDDWGSNEQFNTYYSAPTQSILQKWLRETFSIHISVECRGRYFGDVWIVSKGSEHFTNYKTYESALEEGLKLGLNRIDENGNTTHN